MGGVLTSHSEHAKELQGYNSIQEEEIMFNIIKKIVLVVILARVLSVLAGATPGPARSIAIIGILFCGIRRVFSKDSSDD